MVVRATRLRASPGPRCRGHRPAPAPCRTLARAEALPQPLETAEPLELQLAKSDARDRTRPLDIGEGADRFVEHQRHGRGCRDGGVGVPVIGIAGLLE